MTAQEDNLQRHLREMRESGERLAAERSPEQVKIDAAGALTNKERDALSAADAAVEQAEERWNAAAWRVHELEARSHRVTVMETSNRGKTQRFVTRYPEGYAESRDELPDAQSKLKTARALRDAAYSARTSTRNRIAAAQGVRRRSVKAEHTPPRPPAKIVGNRFAPKESA